MQGSQWSEIEHDQGSEEVRQIASLDNTFLHVLVPLDWLRILNQNQNDLLQRPKLNELNWRLSNENLESNRLHHPDLSPTKVNHYQRVPRQTQRYPRLSPVKSTVSTTPSIWNKAEN